MIRTRGGYHDNRYRTPLSFRHDPPYLIVADLDTTLRFLEHAFSEPRGAGVRAPGGNEWYMATWQDREDAPPGYRD